ncbi:hypothetical protein LSCM4_01116 [Leishmania orientalis]|uniref:J domain-containing protein n=1 Tax=Leishmania orientalis TaxID=2249476 RepID=A0A836G7Q1_9TRYP|nr:hypothetical protein LSCM4_01116 [Leishmania orientalis]
MHRTTRGAPRPAHIRTSALAGISAAATLAPIRCVSQTCQRFASSEVKLPELRTPATIHRGGDVNSSPGTLDSSTALEDSRSTVRRKLREVHLSSTEDRPCPPSSLEPIDSPAPHLVLGKSNTNDTPATPALQKTEGQNMMGPRLSYSSALESLLARQQYVDVYFVVSSLLSDGDGAMKVDAEDERRRLNLLSYRCLCSHALLRFKECCEDGVAAVSLHGHLQGGNSSSSLGASDEVLHSRVARALLGALVMRELYDDALELLGRLPCLRDEESVLVPNKLPDTPLPLLAARRAISSLASFRQCVAARHWGEAAQIIDSSAVARSWVQATPLCAMFAFVRLEQDDPKATRGLLLPYLASLPEPPSWEALSTAPAEHAQLWANFSSHYVFSTTLLAKASFMSGSAYLNIAAALLQRVLRLCPSYASARCFAEFVLSYEAQQKRIDAAMSASDYPMVLSVTDKMLRMPEVTRLVHAELFLARAEAQWMERRPLEVVREATRCVQCDPQCALAFRLRADAFHTMSRDAEAAADRAAAKFLRARVDAIFDELRAQRSRYETAQMEADAKRHSIPLFTSFPSASAPLRSSPTKSFCRGRNRSNPDGARGGEGGVLAASLRTHYDVLGVSSDATEAEIRRCYRRLTLQCHPDRLVGATESNRQAALEAFQLLGNAYCVLSDTQLRATYDATLRTLL